MTLYWKPLVVAREWGGKTWWWLPHPCRYDGYIFAYSFLGMLWYANESELDKAWSQETLEETT